MYIYIIYIKDGEMILSDMGAEYYCYASDITYRPLTGFLDTRSDFLDTVTGFLDTLSEFLYTLTGLMDTRNDFLDTLTGFLDTLRGGYASRLKLSILSDMGAEYYCHASEITYI